MLSFSLNLCTNDDYKFNKQMLRISKSAISTWNWLIHHLQKVIRFDGWNLSFCGRKQLVFDWLWYKMWKLFTKLIDLSQKLFADKKWICCNLQSDEIHFLSKIQVANDALNAFGDFTLALLYMYWLFTVLQFITMNRTSRWFLFTHTHWPAIDLLEID